VGGPSIFRDPSGAVEALTWRCGAVSVVASTLPKFLLEAMPPRLSLDVDLIATWLAAPDAMAGPSALTGVHALAPGALARPQMRDAQVWRPVDWITRAMSPGENLASTLEEVVDHTVASLSGRRQGILVEVSGGLDSSIVSAALVRAPSARIVRWLNYRAAGGEGDERVFARHLACALAFELTEAEKPDFVFTERKLAAVSGGLRPGLNGLDCERDMDVGRRAQAAGADSIFTGQGGDMVFFQTPTPLVAADLLYLRGFRGLADPSLVDTARWLRRSVWSVARLALLAKLGRRTLTSERSSFINASGATPAAHTWLSGLENAPPGKRLQVLSLLGKQTLYGENRRSHLADVVHPLMAQPVMELCLRTPTPVLTKGGRDRALAREAFERRLPQAVVGRRTKGSLGGYYARTVARSLDFLRPFLLEGRLADMKLIDVSRLEPLLTREQLAVRGDYPTILYAAMVEAWIRRWELQISSLRAQL
jgi:asparagine synthase (glutamine-hydrolysing)